MPFDKKNTFPVSTNSFLTQMISQSKNLYYVFLFWEGRGGSCTSSLSNAEEV